MKNESDISLLSDEQLAQLEEQYGVARNELPSLFMGVNVAEYRTFREMYTPEDDGDLAEMVSVEFANGVGKTTMMILDMIGWTMGPEYLKADTYPQEAVDYWNSLAPMRNAGQLTMRLTCDSTDMKPQGSVLELLKQVFPWAKPDKMDTNGCYRMIRVRHPSLPYVTNNIAVLTFDQERTKHEGPTLKRAWINENLPEGLWTATSSRIRGTESRGVGSIAQFATILDKSTHLDGLEDGVNFRLKRCRGHVYENCIGEQVTEEMAAEVEQDIGIQLQKNPAGPGYLTNGVLKRSSIEATIESYMKTNPDEVPARKSGKPLSEGGKIFGNFNREVHEVADDSFENVPADWPMVMLVDPHPARPDAVIWARILGNDRIVIVDEWPAYNEFGYFEKIKDCRFSLSQKTDIWREFEASRGYADKIGDNRVGDPNWFRTPDEGSTEDTIADLYAVQGFDLQIDINDDFEYGRELVNQYLWYDASVRRVNPSDSLGKPRLVIYKRCVNTLRAMENFRRKIMKDKTASISESVDKRFACFAALVRYLCVWHQTHHFSDVRVNPNKMTDYERIVQSRTPKNLRTQQTVPDPKTFNNRQVVGAYY